MNATPPVETALPLPRQPMAAAPDQGIDLDAESARLEALDAAGRLHWALEQFGDRIFLSSSFGAQSAVSLHLATTQRPRIPVVLVDTGYLFPETYLFIDQMRERLGLNLHVYRAPEGPAWQEARHGKLWEQGLEGLKKYNHFNKVEPMRRAIRDLGAKAWIVGLRRQQSSTRQHLRALGAQDGLVKVHPLFDWSDRDIFRYLKAHDLPYHPLWEQGYVSIGDTHSTRRLTDGMAPEETRFNGLKRECGLHEGEAAHAI